MRRVTARAAATFSSDSDRSGRTCCRDRMRAGEKAEEAAPAEATGGGGVAAADPAGRDAYFGDLHVHTRYSFDAFIFGNVRATPDDAYKFARGEAIDHPAGFEIQLQSGRSTSRRSPITPSTSACWPRSTTRSNRLYPSRDREGSSAARPASRGARRSSASSPDMRRGRNRTPSSTTRDVMRAAWSEIVAAAERHNEPGKFTTFIGYEYTSRARQRSNLHRNVIFRGEHGARAPFTALDSQNPEDLWALARPRRAEGMEALAIPHNSNGSNGRCSSSPTRGAAIRSTRTTRDAHAQRAAGRDHAGQGHIGGASVLSPNDEWAEFEIFPYRIATHDHRATCRRQLRARGALARSRDRGRRAAAIRSSFGFIGASDTHVAGGPFEE